MPIRNCQNELILFVYNPSYLREYQTYRNTIPNQEAICNNLNLNVSPSDIILDGGAIEIYGNKAIISDRVISENTTSWKKGIPELLDEIKNLLNLRELIVVPSDPWDFTGHVDGMVRFVNDKKVLVNDLSGMDQKMKEEDPKIQIVYNNWKRNLCKSLENAGLKSEPLPCTVHRNESDESAVGVYMNFLKLEKCIFMPTFGDPDNDDNAKSVLNKWYEREVIPIEATDLAERGGIINCVTWL